ncbi:hypothetical protein [Kiloniella sp. b19]|uniref:hypothetical protein n=1 Tax=Kiloniella sp. GXU_MW_B19 TaxID=3141326 RepID=UPI0031DFC19D
MTEATTLKMHMPSNDLKPKVPAQGGPSLDKIIDKAETALSELEDGYKDTVHGEIKTLVSLLNEATTSDPADSAKIQRIQEICHDIKGQAATFNFNLLSDIAGSLSVMIQKHENIACQRTDVVRAHINALLVVVEQNIKGTGGSMGEELTGGLRKAVEKVTETA